ncbi:MAG: hypothetical protein MJY59_00910 [Bacteroidaceae bacterium]|nr:hypothetical protein [Bacteroidaceae bacterium]
MTSSCLLPNISLNIEKPRPDRETVTDSGTYEVTIRSLGRFTSLMLYDTDTDVYPLKV